MLHSHVRVRRVKRVKLQATKKIEVSEGMLVEIELDNGERILMRSLPGVTTKPITTLRGRVHN